MSSQIKIVDLFAGPGGLGEGFSAFQTNKNYPFKISLSVEKEHSAWKTLRLRSFLRQFIYENRDVPKAYYQYLSGDISESDLFKKYLKEYEIANEEALQLTLGDEKDNKKIFQKIEKKLSNDKNWVLIGGPPCQAYSLVGRARNKGKKGYVAEEDHRHFLYREYLKIIQKFSPAVFVMENVKGILSAKVNGEFIFSKILSDLQNPSKALRKKQTSKYKIYSLVSNDATLKDSGVQYNPKDFIIKSEEYGIPQARHRVILLGVRTDINQVPKKLEKSHIQTIDTVISDLPKLRSGLSKHRSNDTHKRWYKAINDELYPILHSTSHCHKKIAQKLEHILRLIEKEELHKGNKYLLPAPRLYEKIPKELKDWYGKNWQKNRVCNHETRGHMDSDLARYLFCSVYAEINSDQESGIRRSPKLDDFPNFLLPNHKNVKSGKFVDRFKVQVKGFPATTITCHISKDGHYYIHYDPTQCRSLTVREAARIQTFPDNYFFEGNRTQQYVQVGNAVPPLLAFQIGHIVYQLLSGS